MSLRVCNTCHKHLVNSIECPECSTTAPTTSSGRALLIGALMGLGITGCGEKEDTATSEPSTETEPAAEEMYGVAEDPGEE